MRAVMGVSLLSWAFASMGCNIVGAAVVMLHPPLMQDAEIELTDGRLAIFVEYAQPRHENPVFTQTFYDRFAEILRERELEAEVVPLSDVFRMRQANPDFGQWSVQRIGRKLDADQVLYVRVERLSLRNQPGQPLLEPIAELRMKLIDPRAIATPARLWPPKGEPEGRVIHRARQTREAADTVLLDAETVKLARDTAWLAAKPFYRWDTEKKDPWEP